MTSWSAVVLVAVGGAAAVALLGFTVVSVLEREWRATVVAGLLGIACGAAGFAAMQLPGSARLAVVAVLGLLAVAVVILWFLPSGGKVAANGRPAGRVDERDVMFARARLVPDTPEYDSYYSMRPGNRAGDDLTRSLPGLLSPDAGLAEREPFAVARALFDVTEDLAASVDGPVAPGMVRRSPSEASVWVKQLAIRLGAVDAGVTEVKDYHVYSHVGRGAGTWGEAIHLPHRWALAFTVEMDHAVMRTAPRAPVVAESARQYVNAAFIAVRAAAVIRDAGYPARAHIDGNYRVIAPLVALDAGLGEIGRMGILMTPRLGPRVRLGVVTTEMPLEPDPAGDDGAVLDFCNVCRKCVDSCPTNSIAVGDREEIGGGLRWALDADSCFRYWNLVGTDCGRCMTVCPFSHPDNPFHNLVRRAIARSGPARRAALWMDDLFYGRRPSPSKAPVR